MPPLDFVRIGRGNLATRPRHPHPNPLPSRERGFSSFLRSLAGDNLDSCGVAEGIGFVGLFPGEV